MPFGASSAKSLRFAALDQALRRFQRAAGERQEDRAAGAARPSQNRVESQIAARALALIKPATTG